MFIAYYIVLEETNICPTLRHKMPRTPTSTPAIPPYTRIREYVGINAMGDYFYMLKELTMLCLVLLPFVYFSTHSLLFHIITCYKLQIILFTNH